MNANLEIISSENNDRLDEISEVISLGILRYILKNKTKQFNNKLGHEKKELDYCANKSVHETNHNPMEVS
ncbi:MAG: hypothetical protein C4541_03165 [Candidatus Auribacter fodinae]|jgi:hypothetical protein|uniref:Uncharacterized protein n=1 Tax=Candidatus Auribacter fodinae TaxID=2093366 RepID=A0A3A4R8Y7_9BACT|nr:MAG: hypothetical protein C4541_03165 [Candidatus Auribacter fodinae]